MLGFRRAAGGRFVVLLVCAVAVLSGFAASAIHIGLGELKVRDLRRAELKSQDLAQAISLSVANTIDKLDISLRTVASELERLRRDDPRFDEIVHGLIARQFDFVGESEDFSVTDAEGTIRQHGGLHQTGNISLADREYFQRLARGEASGLVVSRPLIGRLTQNPTLVFARSYRTPTQEFGGIVLIPVQIAHFRGLISGYTLGPHDRLSLVLSDATPIVEVPDSAAPSEDLAALLRLQPVNSTFIEGHGEATRIVTVRRLPGALAYTVCSITKRDYLADWRNLRFAAWGVFLAFLAAVVTGAVALNRTWERQRRHALDLAASNARLASALRTVRTLDAALVAARDVGGLGTFHLDIFTGVWTPSAEQRAIFGIPPDYPCVRGAWDVLFHPDDLPLVYAYFEERRANGDCFFDHEYRIIRHNDGAVRWIHGVGRIDRDEDGRAVQFIGAVKDITDAKLRRDRIEYLALHDALTDLPNRALLTDRMRQALDARLPDLLAVCYLDLDGFKPINDRWGHDVGDAVLIELAQRLEASARLGDTVARMGGDEFVVLLCGVETAAEVEQIAERLLAAIGRPYAIGAAVATMTASIGIAVHARDPRIEPDALIRQADQAMYEAKRQGRNRLHLFDPERDRRLHARRAHTARMAEALANHEFRLHFQPRVDLRSGAVDGVEALIRWQHPERGLLPPAEFLPGVEESELAVPIGEWVLREALRHKRDWREQGLDLTVAVNVFGRHLQHPDFVARLAAILGEFPTLSPKGVELEIVETTVMHDLAAASQRMQECARLGVRFALDDFGTGYSSLTYFRRLPVALLKIDRSFVADILDNPGDQALVESIVAMARTFGCATVAEGVESAAHGLPLMRYGCEFAQGYGIARPMPGEEIVAWAAAWRLPEEWRNARADV